MDHSFDDKYEFCFSAYQEELKRSNCGAEIKISSNSLDSRDVDFTLVKQRLSYILNHGCNVICSVEKAILDYFVSVSDKEKNILLEKTIICSLSYGPGFDIVGYLSALHKCGVRFANTPVFTGINAVQSWQPAFQWIISTAYKILEPSYPLHNGNVLFLLRDIIDSTQELEINLANYDILLMAHVFNSTKVTSEVVFDVMMKIFQKMKIESLIFFIGSKNRMQKVIEIVSGIDSVSVKHGPIKISPEKLTLNSSLVKLTGIMPRISGKLRFAVFQKTKHVLRIKNLDFKSQNAIKTNEKIIPTIFDASVSETSRDETSSFLSHSSVASEILSGPYSILPDSSSPSEVSSDSSREVPKNELHSNKNQSNFTGSQINDSPSLKNDDLSHSLSSTFESLNKEGHLGVDNKRTLAETLKELVCKGIENGLNGLSLSFQSSSINFQEQDKHICNEYKSKSFDNLSPSAKKRSENITNIRARDVIVDKNERPSKSATTKCTSSSTAIQQDVLQHEAFISMIEKCQNSVDGVKMLVENMNSNIEKENKSNPCLHSCSENFASHNTCRNSFHSSYQQRQSYCRKSSCCNHQESCCIHGCTSPDKMLFCCGTSPCSAMTPCCSTLHSCSGNKHLCCQNGTAHKALLKTSCKSLHSDCKFKCPFDNPLQSGYGGAQFCCPDVPEHFQSSDEKSPLM